MEKQWDNRKLEKNVGEPVFVVLLAHSCSLPFPLFFRFLSTKIKQTNGSHTSQAAQQKNKSEFRNITMRNDKAEENQKQNAMRQRKSKNIRIEMSQDNQKKRRRLTQETTRTKVADEWKPQKSEQRFTAKKRQENKNKRRWLTSETKGRQTKSKNPAKWDYLGKKNIQGAWRICLWRHWHTVGSLRTGEKFAHCSSKGFDAQDRHGRAWDAISSRFLITNDIGISFFEIWTHRAASPAVDADREIAISPFVFRLPAHLPPFRPLKHRKVLLFSLSVLKVFVPLIWTKKTENQVWYNETQETRPRCEEVLPLCPFDDPRMVINIPLVAIGNLYCFFRFRKIFGQPLDWYPSLLQFVQLAIALLGIWCFEATPTLVLHCDTTFCPR